MHLSSPPVPLTSRSPATARFQRRTGPRPAAGFTLVELLVAMTVSTLILIAALTVFDSARRLTRRNLTVTDAQQSGTYALQEAGLNLRRAGFGSGAMFAIVTNKGLNTGTPLATWNNYATSMSTLADTEAGGGTPYKPVPGTDGITVRFTDLNQPPLHVCYAAGSNTSLDVAANATYINSGTYPLTTSPDNQFDLVTQNVTCYGGATNASTNSSQLSITGVAMAQNCGGGTPAPSNSANTRDLACQSATYGQPKCVRVTLGTAPQCDLTQVVSGSNTVLLYPSHTASYWISTEDRNGDPSVSPPVLVSRNGLAGTTRILSSGVEDLQLVYYRADTAATPNTLIIHDSGVAVSTSTPNILPTNVLMPDVRAIRLDLIARAGVTDLLYRNKTYCTTKAGLVPLFSRPVLDDHPAAASGAADYCDGFRRTVFTQLVNMPNMVAKPNGK